MKFKEKMNEKMQQNEDNELNLKKKHKLICVIFRRNTNRTVSVQLVSYHTIEILVRNKMMRQFSLYERQSTLQRTISLLMSIICFLLYMSESE